MCLLAWFGKRIWCTFSQFTDHHQRAFLPRVAAGFLLRDLLGFAAFPPRALPPVGFCWPCWFTFLRFRERER